MQKYQCSVFFCESGNRATMRLTEVQLIEFIERFNFKKVDMSILEGEYTGTRDGDVALLKVEYYV